MLVRRTKIWANSRSTAVDTADPDHSEDTTPETRQSKYELQNLKKAQKTWRFSSITGNVLFALGIIFGVALGLAFIKLRDIHDIHAHMAVIMNEYDINLPHFPGLDFSRVEAEWTRFRGNIPEIWKFNNDGREFQVGDSMKARGLTAVHPVVLIPGIISTSLESWSTSPDYRPFFREKLWGGFNMMSQVTFNREKWIAAMMLDPVTGLDPPDVKIRATEGINAATSFIQGYWIWSKIVENLAVVNYDTNNLDLAAYDWRLSYNNLEERDGYFSKLKTKIESFKRRHKKKVVLAAHSMGATVLLYFFKWVESPKHGAGGSNWVEDHIEAYISIAGSHLGVAKALPAFLSGEMKDTVQMNPAGAYVLERFFSRKERQRLFRSWAGSASMWMKGGNTIWGNGTHAPDDESEASHTHGQLIAFRPSWFISPETAGDIAGNMTAEEAGAWILQHTPSAFQKMIATNYSFGIERNVDLLKMNDLDPMKWTNPLEVRLPYAPSMKIYCVYGHGKETERSYWYTKAGSERDNSHGNSPSATCRDPSVKECVNPDPKLDMSTPRDSWIDAAYTDEAVMPKVRNGVKLGEGDGTVSLLSLGAMCTGGWKRPTWNPARIKITTIELSHRPVPSIPRGGANTSDHVDILGSTRLNEIILKIATGVGHEVKENYVSNIREYSQRIQWD